MSEAKSQELRRRIIEYVSGVQTGSMSHMEATDGLLALTLNYGRASFVKGRCPSCGFSSLFLGKGDYITCSNIDCRNPSAAHKLLATQQHSEEEDTS